MTAVLPPLTVPTVDDTVDPVCAIADELCGPIAELMAAGEYWGMTSPELNRRAELLMMMLRRKWPSDAQHVCSSYVNRWIELKDAYFAGELPRPAVPQDTDLLRWHYVENL